MEGLKIDKEPFSETEKPDKKESVYNVLRQDSQEQILAKFTKEEQEEILRKKQILSSLAYFIGKDFRIPVELNQPRAGWHWDFEANIIKVDPKDLLEKSMDYLRFVISHEGGHRRISRTSFIPLEVWRQKGFSFLMNVVEDPRDNNFVADNYPGFLEQMKLAYGSNSEQEKTAKDKAKDVLGYQPRFMQAGFEFIKLWFKEKTKEEMKVSSELPDEIKEVIKETIESARNAWWSYPTKNEADNGGVLPDGKKTDGEEIITEFAKQAYEVILEEVWPAYQKLVKRDLEDQKTSELLKDFLKEKQEREGENSGENTESRGKSRDGLPKELEDKLSPEEQKELEEAIEKAIKKAKKEIEQEKKKKEGQPGKEKESESKKSEEKTDGKNIGKPKAIDMDSLSPSLKQKIKDFIGSLPDDKKKELSEKSEKTLEDFEKEIGKEMEGRLSENPEEKKEKDEKEQKEIAEKEKGEPDDEDKKESQEAKDKKEIEEKRKKLQKESEKILENVRKGLEGQIDEYQKEMTRLAPQMRSLKEKLAEIFQERQKRGIKSGFEEGEEIDVEKRLQEKAKGISIFESKAWRRTELPREKDYAITLLVDLSGSMQGEKIKEAFEATVLFTEVLNSLGIKTEILGFNIRLYEYQKFNECLSGDIRKKIITMKKQVNLPGNEDNDDGWAVSETIKRLEVRKEKEKLLLVISDGEPDDSSEHSGEQYELGSVVEKITKEGRVKIVGLGLGSSGISAVKHFYPKHLLANSAEEMIEKIGGLLLEVIRG